MIDFGKIGAPIDLSQMVSRLNEDQKRIFDRVCQVCCIVRVPLKAPFIEFTDQPLTSCTVKVQCAAQGVAESQIRHGGVVW